MKNYVTLYFLVCVVVVILVAITSSGCGAKPEVRTEYIYKTVEKKVPVQCEQIAITEAQWDTNYAITFKALINELKLRREIAK